MLAALAACWRSASSQMIIGSDPPSSSVTRFTPEAHRAMMRSPIGVEPVNATLRTVGWADQPLARPRAAARDDVEGALREPTLKQQLAEPQRRQGRGRGRLG